MSGRPAKFREKEAASRALSRATIFADALEAFGDEMRAYATYQAMARLADREDLIVIAQVFRESAEQELTHAEVLKDLLGEEPPESFESWTQSDQPSGKRIEPSGRFASGEGVREFPLKGSSRSNLEEAIIDETQDRDSYEKFAVAAREEGFNTAFSAFSGLASAENFHRARFAALLETLSPGYHDPQGWKCRRCGWTRLARPKWPSGQFGEAKLVKVKRPNECVVCGSTPGYFEALGLSSRIMELL